MKKWIREILPRGNEAVLAVVLLLLYAAALFLSPDPEWTMWAAQMAMGVLYIPDPPTMQGIAQGDAVQTLSVAGALGILGLAALLALRTRTSGTGAPDAGPFLRRIWKRKHCERSHGTVSHAEVSRAQMEGEGGEHDGRHPDGDGVVRTRRGFLFFAGLILLALVATAILLGYTAEEESKGNRLFWAEWPLPGSGEPASPAVERESLKTA